MTPLVQANTRLLSALLCCALISANAAAQLQRHKLTAPTGAAAVLDELLDRLEPNLLDYRKSIPNLFCTEKAEISRLSPGGESGVDPSSIFPSDAAHTVETNQSRESTFRMQRLSAEGTVGLFQESRIVTSVDGRPPTAANSNEASLALIYGVFSNGLNILSNQGRACYGFSIHSQNKKEILVDFAELPKNERAPQCADAEETTGRISVDASTLHVTHIVTRIPHHQLVPGLYGSWEWSEEFAPVRLLNREFWLPRTIKSRSASDDRVRVWKFTAHYANYRLFHTDSQILPASASGSTQHPE